MRRSWCAGVVCASITALLLAGCSSSSKKDVKTSAAIGSPVASGDNATLDPKSLVPQMFAAVKAADSFHVVGSGKDDDGTPFELDVHFGDGGGSGHFSEGATRFDLAGHAGDIYVKTSAAAWKATIGNKPGVERLAATLAAHWVKVPSANANFAELGQYVDKDAFVTSFSQSAANGSGPFEKSGTSAVNGTAAVVFTDTKDQSKIFVAAHGAPLLLKVEAAPSDGGGGLALTEYNKPFAPHLPPAAEVIDYATVVK